MKDVNAIISKVLTTPEEFPDCIVVVCKSISNGIVIRKESAAKQRGTGEFAHVRKFWLKAIRNAKPERNTKMMRLQAASREVWREFGREAYENFVTVRSRGKTHREYNLIDGRTLLGMWKLFEADAVTLYDLTKSLMVGDTNLELYHNFNLGIISDARVSQIVAFRLMKSVEGKK